MAKYKGLDGKEYQLRLKKNNGRFRSSYHQKAYDLFKQVYPLYPVYEETKLCGTKNDLYVDIFCPSLSLMIEIHGAQHYAFNPFFHQNIAEYARTKARDNEKIQWCDVNNITLLEFKYNEEEKWQNKLLTLSNE